MNEKLRVILRIFFIIIGILLIYSGLMLVLSTKLEIKEMMILAKVKPIIPLPFSTMEFAFLFNGVIIFIIGLRPFFALYLSKKQILPILIRILSIFSSIVMINPLILEIGFILHGKVDFLAIATAPGLYFPGGLFIHVFFEHWLGGILGFSIGVYPKIFASLGKILRKISHL